MYTSPDNMPADARVWVFQSNRAFLPEELNSITEQARQFIENWTAHEQALLASFEIRYHRFLILMIDQHQAQASGCSIDKSIHFIQKIEKQFAVTLLDRMQLAYKVNDEVIVVHRNKFEELIEKGSIDENTIVFNNLVQSKMELDAKWEVPLRISWHKALLEV